MMCDTWCKKKQPYYCLNPTIGSYTNVRLSVFVLFSFVRHETRSSTTTLETSGIYSGTTTSTSFVGVSELLLTRLKYSCLGDCAHDCGCVVDYSLANDCGDVFNGV